ncbi:MAG: hypothetical protein CL670_08900 [Balneola sp.]|jgi:hypothetical protein|nr:hypothetical protein [Balneola sp.]MBE79256.1 hypothetical protein [Balneola sp.]|tara:strand:- start:1384 stop:1887 length:504 start_codon:yes stop_codon:yes gene_type:complete
MKYSLIAIFIIVSSFSAFAQIDDSNSITANINVSAEVIQSIELITVNTMQFGNAQPGQREIYVNPVNSLNAGYMIAVGTPDAEFRLNYLPELELTQIQGQGTLNFTYEISGNSEENQSTSELLELDNRNIRFNNEGRYYIWVGGRVNIENAPPGNYEGDFTIEIDYI